MKRCCYCYKDLEGSNGITCEKCKTNEAKYGKPCVCKYCQLPAAFLDEKCVHCSYAERKYGSPVACSKCQLKCAFPKTPLLKTKPILCRLCVLAHGPSSSSTTRTSPSKSSSKKRCSFSNVHVTKSSTKSGVQAPFSETAASGSSSSASTIVPPLTSKKSRRDSIDHHVDAGTEHILTIQQLRDNILELTRTIQLRDKLLQEKDRTIAELRADSLRRDKDHRQKLLAVEKQNNDMVGPLRDQIKNLTRQVVQLQKLTKSSGSVQSTTAAAI